MSANRERFLHQFATVEAFLSGEAWVDSDHLMSGTCSLDFKYIEKRTPTRIHDALSKGMKVNHASNIQIFHTDVVILLGVRLCDLEVEVSPLPLDLQVCQGHTTCGLAASLAALLTSGFHVLFTAQGFLRRTIEAGILNSVALAISEEGLKSHINADKRMQALRGKMLCLWFHFTGDESVPMSISAPDKVNCPGFALDRAVQLDLKQFAQFGRDMQVFAVLIQPGITESPILPERNTVPAIGRFETGEANGTDPQFTGAKKAFEGFGETISKHLHSSGWHVFTSTPLEGSREVILARKCTLFLILMLHHGKHFVIQLARLDQALHEQVTLFFLRIKPILKRFHAWQHSLIGEISQEKGPLRPISKDRVLWLFYDRIV